MNTRVRRSAAGLGAIAAGLMLFCGCGPQENAAAPDVATAIAAKKPPNPSPEPITDVSVATALVAKYWAFDRFVYDEHELVPLEPMFSPAEEVSPLIAKAQRDVDFGAEIAPWLSSDAYVWGLVRSGGDLWFGTVANTLCYAQQGILNYGLPPFPPEYMEGYWKCDFGILGGKGEMPPRYGDWRPPHIYRYDTEWSEPDVFLEGVPGGPLAPLPPLFLMDPDPIQNFDAEVLRNLAIGFRSAGASEGVIFLAGPSVDDSGVILFAYRDTEPPEFLAATQLHEYNNVRSWVTYAGQLYVGVGVKSVGGPYGAVLRWTGHVNKDDPYDPTTLFQFEKVGDLETEAANLAIHQGRIYVTTWPFWTSPYPSDWKPIGLFRSPEIPEGGWLTGTDAGAWTKLWSISSYDPDLVAALSTGGGALESFGDSIYWGTMHVPFSAGLAAFQLSDMYPRIFYDPSLIDGTVVARVVNMMLGGHRSPALFRGRDVVTRKGAKFEITLLYGEKYLPKAVLPPGGDGVYRVDATRPYATGYTPLYGASGFGNFFNAYIWSAANFGDRLWLGTFDWSQPFRVGVQTITNTQPDPESSLAYLMYRVSQVLLPLTGNIVPREGADLYRFDSADGPAVAEDLTGLGNDTNYGFRTMVTGPRPVEPTEVGAASALPVGRLYIGTANAMNLHPRGGWELLQLPAPPKKPVCKDDCSDENACTIDICDAGACVHSPVECAEGQACDPAMGCVLACTTDTECEIDLDACTIDTCTAGVCGRTFMDCDDGLENTIDKCLNGVCQHVLMCPSDCSDGDVCTNDTCFEGACVHSPVGCEPGETCFAGIGCARECATHDDCDTDLDACTIDTCIDGYCANRTWMNCDDKNYNNIDKCVAGVCQHACKYDCSDGDACTTDTCDESTSWNCVHTPITCDEGYFCDSGVCEAT